MADVHEMYHGTAADRVESIKQRGLRASDVGSTLSNHLDVACAHAILLSEDSPVVLVYEVPGDRFDEYFYEPRRRGGRTFYALRRDLPGDWMMEVIPKTDSRVTLFYR